MIDSVFSSLSDYFKRVYFGFRSIFSSALTILPYFLRINAGDLRKEVTEQYPDPISSRTAADLPSRSRGLLFNDIERCTGCKECERTCPVKCIQVECDPGPDAEKLWVRVFDVDFSKCIFCGFCVEVCQPASLVHTREYEAAAYSLADLMKKFGRGIVSSEQKAKWVVSGQEKGEGGLHL